MDDLAAPASVFLLQHPLANPKDPPVAIPTLTARQRQNPPTQVPPTPTSLTASLSPPGSPPLAARPPRQSPHHSHSHQSSTAVSITSAVSISSKALQSQPAQLSLARDLTTRLWQREAELQRMKDLYDAKIRCLTEMLQDAGVSPTEVANNLAVVTEKRVVRKPLFDQLASPTSEHLAETGRGRLPEGFFDEDSNSIAGREADLGIDNEDNGTPPHSGHTNGIDHRRDDDDNNNNNNNNDNNTSNGEDEEGSSECVSCSDSTSVLSSCPTHRSKRPLEVKASSTQTLAVARAAMATPTTSTWTSLSSGEGVGACGPPPCSPTTSDSSSSLSSSFTASSHSHQRRTVHTVHSVQANTDGTSPVADTKLEVNAQTETTAASQSPIPSFIAESLAAGTMGIKSLREKWAIASGVLSWNKPRPDSHGNSTSTSANASMVTSPSGLFVRQEGIMNDKKPALVEACIPPPLQDDLTSLCSDREKDPWAAIVPVPSRKYAKGHGLHVRPMSDVGYLSGTSGLSSKYPAFTMAKDIPRPPISRIHEYLRQPDSFTPSSNPSPLHYRAISMAANLIDTGAITPAKLYARRTQTMIAKWTLGLIMNSKQRNSPNSFPVVRESHPEEEGEGEEEDLEERKRRPHGRDLDSTEDNGASSRNGVADLASSYEARRPDMLSPTDIPRALSSFRNHPTSTPLSSSYQPPSSLLYQSHFSPSTRSVVELSDISPAPLSMSPTFSYLGEAQRPLTDRYGFLVNARPMAVQQGLLKLNDVYGLESDFSDRGSSVHQPHHQDRHHDRSPSRDLTDSMSANEKNCEFLQTPTEEIEKRSLGPSSPPSIPPLSYFSASRMSASSASSVISSSALGPAAVVTLGTGSVGASGTGAIGTSTTPATSTPSSIPTSTTTPILSTATRPMSTLSPPNSNSATVTSLLSQIKVLHDSVQLTQKEKWDAFLRKRRRRIHMGEANGGLSGNLSSTNLSSPLFGSLIMSPPDQEDQDDEDMVYWSSVCMIGIATMGKGSDWEEFRDLVRGGIPVAYRNKIWQETSGAYDTRQPGYYKELLNKQALESCVCWGDIEMDLHRTFPTNILFGPGGHGIEKLKNILLAYSLHNPTVGYCQGMNLLAGTLLLTNNSEEEAFWILTAMMVRHLPDDYFTQQLLSPQADQRVLKDLVQEIMPRLSTHFQEMHVDLTAVTFSWFLTLFTDCLPVETLLRVWDVFFVEGMMVVFRIAVAILWMNEKEILKCKNGAAVYCFMKQMTLGMHQADKLLKVAFVTLKSYIHPEKVEPKRIRHQQAVRQELLQEQQLRQMRTFAACASSPPGKKREL